MNRDAAVGWVQHNLGRRTDLVTECQNALIAAQVALEGEDFLPWFLRTEVATATTTAGEERVAAPDDFIREWEEDALYILDSDSEWVRLTKNELGALRDAYKGVAADFPVDYALDGFYFRLFPTPDDIYTLKMIFYAHDTALSTNIENKWLKYAPWMVIGRAVTIMAPGLRDKVAQAEGPRIEAEAKNRLVRSSEALDHTSRRYQMGGPL